MQMVYILPNRLFECSHAETFHKVHVDSIGRHKTAIDITLVYKLRENGGSEELSVMVSYSDAHSTERANESFYYCVDVIRVYLIEGDCQLSKKEHDIEISHAGMFHRREFV